MRLRALAFSMVFACNALLLSTCNANAAFQWTIVAADTTGDIGRFSSLVLDDVGNPHISYRESVNRAVWYATHDGSTWTREVAAPSSEEFNYNGSTTSIAVTSLGRVGIICGYPQSNDLLYAERNSGTWTRRPLDFEGGAGRFSSLAFDTLDQPHVAYDDNPGVFRDFHRVGTDWVIEVIESSAAGSWPSIRRGHDGKLVVAYHGASGGVKLAGRDGTIWTGEVVDPLTDVGVYNSLALDSLGTAHISYSQGPCVYDLRYAVRVDGLWQIDVIDTIGATGYFTSIAVDESNNPWIAYTAYRPDGLVDVRVAHKQEGVWSISVLSTFGTLLDRASIAVDELGRAHVSYYDFANGDLMYAVSSIPTSVAPAEYASPLTLMVAPNPTKRGYSRFTIAEADGRSGCIDIYEPSGRHIRSLTFGASSARNRSVEWDGRNESGGLVAAGVYIVNATVGASRTSSKLVVLR